MMILPYAMVYPSSQILIGDGDHYCVYHIITSQLVIHFVLYIYIYVCIYILYVYIYSDIYIQLYIYTYVHISYRQISHYFPLRPYYLTKQTILFHQCFIGVSAQHYVSSRFLGSCVAGLVQLRTCHRRWQREPVIALVAPLQTVQSLDIVGYVFYWI